MGRPRRQLLTPRSSGAPAPAAVHLDLDGLLQRLVVPPELPEGRPNPTQRAFVFSPDRYKAYMGLVGCAKTSSLCASAIIPALLYPGSRWLVTRAVQWTLRETTKAALRTMLLRLGAEVILHEVDNPVEKIWVRPMRKDGAGNYEPSEFFFHAVDDLQKVGSTEFTGILVDEMNELSQPIIDSLKARLRQRRTDGTMGPYFMNMAFNPTSRAHWVYKSLSGGPGCEAPFAKVFRPRPRENEHNLPPGYYEAASKGMSADSKRRLINGEWGPDPRGKGVYTEDFNAKIHVADDLVQVPRKPMVRAWDFGRRRPAVVWAQVLEQGHVNYLLEELGEDESLEKFATRILQISAVRFPDASAWVDFCDPHGKAKKDVSDKSSFDVLEGLGIKPMSMESSIDTGIDAVMKGLTTMVKGRPRSCFSRTGCPDTIEGFEGGYIFPEAKPGVAVKDKPQADGYYEHLMDAVRYMEINILSGTAARSTTSDHAKTLRKTPPNPVTGH